ncbi:MAG: aminotransferase class I/II-fold pyridoxal phosphate-dependent enzyme [Candidatus Gastranaerophilales bacterium]|nr:aminotransferase class I/II-fold pyridoxal phosphate-dependent enzyme [Candidatus Gastranaerophilales bacterium]
MEFQKYEDRVWLASPTMHEEEQEYINEAFDANWVSTVGANLTELEAGICQYVGCKNAVALSAGTAALHLAVKLARVRQGDKVFCSDMTFAATVNPVSYEKGEPVFIDSERDTWNMDPVALKRAFSFYPDTKVVIVANLYGTPAKLDEIRAICDDHGAILIEDAAESLGAEFRGVQTGTFGKYNVISFNGNKIITTSGGGMLLTDEKEAAEKARFWSTQARENFPWYQHEELGYNYRMSNILAGIGRGQLLHLEEHKALKEGIYRRYQEGLKELPITMNPYLAYTKPNFWLSCMLIDEGCSVTPDVIRERLEDYNVESRPIWKPMHMQPLYQDRKFVSAADGMDVGADIFARGLCLPSDIKMTVEVQETVMEIIRSCF